MALERGKEARFSVEPARSTDRSGQRKKQLNERRVSYLLFHSRFHAGLYAHVIFHFEGAINLFAKFVQNFAGGVRDVSIFQHTRTRQVDGKFAFYATGPESEQSHAITKANRLANVVSDK